MKNSFYPEQPLIHINRKRGCYRLLYFTNDIIVIKTKYEKPWIEPITEFSCLCGKQALSMKTYALINRLTAIRNGITKSDYIFANSVQHKLFTILSFKL